MLNANFMVSEFFYFKNVNKTSMLCMLHYFSLHSLLDFTRYLFAALGTYYLHIKRLAIKFWNLQCKKSSKSKIKSNCYTSLWCLLLDIPWDILISWKLNMSYHLCYHILILCWIKAYNSWYEVHTIKAWERREEL